VSVKRLVALCTVVVLCGMLAIAGTEFGPPALTMIFKPLTTLLLLVVVGRPTSAFASFVDAGIALSLVGDIALLSDGNLAFKVGLGAFLLAHIAYVAGGVTVGVFSPRLLVVAALVMTSTSFLLATIWPGAEGARAPTVVYGGAITCMVIASWSTLGGKLAWARLAAAGALLFYISDASLALNRFHRPIPHVSLLSMGVYWLGQLGIALAARGGLLEAADRPRLAAEPPLPGSH